MDKPDDKPGHTIRLNGQCAEIFKQYKAELEKEMRMRLTVSQTIICLINKQKETK